MIKKIFGLGVVLVVLIGCSSQEVDGVYDCTEKNKKGSYSQELNKDGTGNIMGMELVWKKRMVDMFMEILFVRRDSIHYFSFSK